MPIFSSAALIMGAVSAGTSIAGDIMQSNSAASANAANEQINQDQLAASWNRQKDAEEYNTQQAQTARDFSAQQVSQQEDFQREQLGAVENYNTQMSDTAMQRRVADLRAAGINPLLAVSQGGASTPTAPQFSGSAASGQAASISPGANPSQIPMQSTGNAYGNLGGQMSNAMSVAQMAANVDLMKAQTDNLNSKTQGEVPAQIDYLKSMSGLNDRQADQAYYNTQRIQEQTYGERLSNDQLRDVMTPLQSQNLAVLQATRDALISAQQSDATAKRLNLSGLRNQSDVQQSNLGRILTYLNAILEPISTGAKAAAPFIP